MRILVVGANGFIGSAVARHALSLGLDVLGLARRGKPETHADWPQRITWIAADAFLPETWASHLAGCAAVIHCIGLLDENRDLNITYERFNHEAAVVVARQAVATGVERFVMLSASGKPPGRDARYLLAKRAAERDIEQFLPDAVFLRPGPVVGPGRPMPGPVRVMLAAVSQVPGLRRWTGKARPLPAEIVAAAAVAAARDHRVRGVVDIDGIVALARVGGL